MAATLYFFGAFLGAAVAVVFAKSAGGKAPSRAPVPASVVAIAAALWPLLIIGLLQLLAIHGIARAVRARVQPIPDHLPPELVAAVHLQGAVH